MTKILNISAQRALIAGLGGKPHAKPIVKSSREQLAHRSKGPLRTRKSRFLARDPAKDMDCSA